MSLPDDIAKAVIEMTLQAALDEIDRLRGVCRQAYIEGFEDAGAYKWTNGNMRHLWENSNAAFDMMNPPPKESKP